MSDLLTAALRYAARGWLVVPLWHVQSDGSCACGNSECGTHAGKHPRVKGWQRCATTDPDMIRDWWRIWPKSNVAIVTGRRSGLLVLDVDEGGEDSLDAGGSVPDTITSSTGNGTHRYFAHPGVDLPNAVKFLPGLDIRTDGGLVVAPPSRHYSGVQYQWLIEPEEMEGATRLPSWVVDAIKAAADKEKPAPKRKSSPAQGGATPYAMTALDKEVAAITATLNGGRNHQLNRSAFTLGTLVGGGALQADEARDALMSAAMAVGLGADEARATVASGLQAGMAKPRAVEAPRRPDVTARGVTVPGSVTVATSHAAGGPPPSSHAQQPAGDWPNISHNTDLGNAERFIRQHGHQLRYVPKWDTWLVWDGTRWVKDETSEVYRMARATVRGMYREAGGVVDESERKELAKWALASEAKARLEAMIGLAQSEEGIPVKADMLDADTYLLNCQNGIIDLRTGQLGPHDPAAMITKRVNAAYDPAAQCPTWLKFLDRIFKADTELIEYIQRAVGYTLTGSTQEQCLFFAYGTGRNGKSTFFEVLLKLLAEYGQKAQTELIMAKREGAASNDVARLAGSRLVLTAEIEAGRRLAEGLVKDLTGDDTLTARFLYQEAFQFTPTHKLWIYGNHKPEIKGTDPGIWRRIRVIPFEVHIPPEEVDPGLRTKLLIEMPGILAWAVRGCLDHQRHGLPIPSAVQAATAGYREEMDVLAAFMSECCVISPKAQTRAKDLYRAYVQWCEENGEHAQTQRRLGQQLNDRGFERRKTGADGAWFRIGIGILSTRSEDDDPTDPTDPTDVTDVTDPISESSLHEKKKVGFYGNFNLTSVTSVNSPDLPPPGQGQKDGREAQPLPPRPRELAAKLSTAQWAEAVMAWRGVNTTKIRRMAKRLEIDPGELIKAIQAREQPILPAELVERMRKIDLQIISNHWNDHTSVWEFDISGPATKHRKITKVLEGLVATVEAIEMEGKNK